MSWTASKNQRCCATCANWAGPRTEKYGSSAETESPSVRGKCYAGVPADSTPGPTAMAGTCCSKYQKWSALK